MSPPDGLEPQRKADGRTIPAGGSGGRYCSAVVDALAVRAGHGVANTPTPLAVVRLATAATPDMTELTAKERSHRRPHKEPGRERS